MRASEVTDHPNTRLTSLGADGEMPCVRRGKPPERSRLRLQPNRLGMAVEVDMQQRSAGRSQSGYKQAPRVNRPAQIRDVGIAVYCNGPWLVLPERHEANPALVPLRNGDPRTVGRELPCVIRPHRACVPWSSGMRRRSFWLALSGSKEETANSFRAGSGRPRTQKLAVLIRAPILSEAIDAKQSLGRTSRDRYSIKRHFEGVA